MSNIVYLLNMHISGVKNIEEEISIDFYGKAVNKNFDPEKFKIKGIYGENGSGKTAIITGVSIVKDLILNAYYLSDPQNQLILNEIINKNKRELSFKCEYLTNIETLLIFEYEIRLSLDENNEAYISYESLKYKKNNSKNMQTILFICQNGEFTTLNADETRKSIIIEKTRNLLIRQSALLMIIGIIGEVKVIDELAHVCARAIIFFILLQTHFDREDKHADYYQRKKIRELKDSFTNDTSIEEVLNRIPTNEKKVPIESYQNYENNIRKLERFIRLFKPDLKQILIDKTEDKEFFICDLVMDYGTYRVNREFESTGIKKIIELFDALVLSSGGAIVFIDEMDSNINDVYLCKLIEYYKYYGRGQLCFTSHNTDPMAVLKENNKSIDFLTRDNRIVPWVKNGHYTPDNSYRNGMIDGMPFNIDSSDFIKVFEGA